MSSALIIDTISRKLEGIDPFRLRPGLERPILKLNNADSAMDWAIFLSLYRSFGGRIQLGCMIFLAAFALSWVCMQLPMARFRRAANSHWTERAALLYQAGRLLRFQHFFYLAVALFISFSGDALSWSEPAETIYLSALFLSGCALLGTQLTHYLVVRRVFPIVAEPKTWIRQIGAAYAPFLFHTFVYIGIAITFAEYLSWPYSFSFAIAWLIVYTLSIAGGWLAPYRLLGLLLPPPPRLQIIIEETAKQMKVPYPRHIYILNNPLPYAGAMPSTGTLLYSRGILELLGDDELMAITAHEIMHLEETSAQVALRCLPAIAVVPLMLFGWWMFSENVFALAVAYALILLLVNGATRGLSRRLEVRADSGAHVRYASGGVYARALEKLYEARLVPATVPRRFQTHPDLYDRLIAAGSIPSFPRPALPPTRELGLGIAFSFIVFIVLFSSILVSASGQCNERRSVGCRSVAGIRSLLPQLNAETAAADYRARKPTQNRK